MVYSSDSSRGSSLGSSNLSGFSFSPESRLQSQIQRSQQNAGSNAIPTRFVSDMVKAGSVASGPASLEECQLLKMAESAFGIEKVKQEKTRVIQELAAAQAKILRLEADRREMEAYFEEHRGLVSEQEEVTAEMMREREDIDAEMRCLVSQRAQIASDRAQLIIEISAADGVHADLDAQQMDVSRQLAELRESIAALDARSGTRSGPGPEKHEQGNGQGNGMEIAEEAARLRRLQADLDAKAVNIEAEQRSAVALREELVAKQVELDTERAQLDSDKAALEAEKLEVTRLVADLQTKSAELEAEQERANSRWATLDVEAARLSRERTHLDDQLREIAAAWAALAEERERLETLAASLAVREAAVAETEEAAAAARDPFARRNAKPRPGILACGDSPRELEAWQGACDIDGPSSGAASEIDSLEDLAVADSAGSLDGYRPTKERATRLKADGLRVIEALSNPEELSKVLKRLNEWQARIAHREMLVDAREGLANEQDRRFEAEEMMREWALRQRETALAAKEAEAGREASQNAKRDAELGEMRAAVARLRAQLEMAMGQCASSERALRALQQPRRWARSPDDSVLTSLRSRGMDVGDFYVQSKLLTV